ncbi:MAG: CAP domain-containing protein [Bacillota bacterium]
MSEVPRKLRSARFLVGLFLLLATAGLVQPDTAEASSSIYNWKYYQQYRPNGSSVVETPSVPSSPPAPSQPPAPQQPPTQPPAPPAPVGTQEALMVGLINQERARVGAGPLELDPVLSDMALRKAQYMAANGYYNHYVPGYNYPYLAENLTGAPSVEMAHWLLLGSPAHARTLRDPRYTGVGIGIAGDRSGGVLVIQLFR